MYVHVYVRLCVCMCGDVYVEQYNVLHWFGKDRLIHGWDQRTGGCTPKTQKYYFDIKITS